LNVKRQALLAVGVGSALLFTALFLAMTASAAKTAPAGSKPTKACYANQFQEGGDTSATLDDIKTDADFEIEPNGNNGGGEEWPEAEGTVNTSAWFTIVDSTLRGYAKIEFTITRENGKTTKGSFVSKCIAEGGTEEDGESTECIEEDGPIFGRANAVRRIAQCPEVTDQFEAEWEGTVTGLPFSEKKQAAVASLSGYEDLEGNVFLHLGIDQGKTCLEFKGEIGAANEDELTPVGNLEADDTEAFVATFPEFCD
jgi:hypothetical protein